MTLNAENVKLYTDYLDKEMTITGVLSTFCVAVPALVVERVASADKGFLADLWKLGSPYLFVASLLMLVASGVFFKQRSLLAWYYGQISLKLAVPDHATKQVREWMQDADSWRCWIPYNVAFWLAFAALIEYAFAILTIYVDFMRHRTIALIPIVLFVGWAALRVPMMLKYSDEDIPWPPSIRRIFMRG